MRRKLKVGLVGFGRWGRKLARGLLALPQLELVGVCDNAQAAYESLRLLGAEGVAAYSELNPLLQHPQIEALVVATPADSHAQIARAGLQAGLHVFVEKPLALSVADAGEVLDCAQLGNKVLMVGHILHHDPAVIAARRLIQGGPNHDISLCLSQRINVGQAAPLAAWWDLAPHDLALFLSVLGKGPQHLEIDLDEVRVDSSVRLQQGIGRLSVGFGQERVRRMAWIGSERALCLCDEPGLPRLVEAQLTPGAAQLLQAAQGAGATVAELWRQLAQATRSRREIPVPASDALSTQLEHFAHCALQGLQPISNAAEGMAVVELLALGEALAQQRNIGKHCNTVKLINGVKHASAALPAPV
jgi:predicted dehydrogenase